MWAKNWHGFNLESLAMYHVFSWKKKLYEIECIAYSKAKGLHSCDYHIITSWKREGESGSKVQIYTINTISFHLNVTHHISVVVNLTHVKKKTAFDIDILFMQLKIFTNVKDIYTECISKRNMFFYLCTALIESPWPQEREREY